MKNLFVIGSLILGYLVQAQSDFTYKTSGQLLVEAYTHLGNEETEKGIDVFSEIHESDSLYSSAQLSKLVSQFSLNDFKGTIESCDELLHRDLDLLDVAYEWKIKSLTKLKKFVKAHEIIATGKRKYPLYFKYDFEKAKLLLEEKKYEEAKKLLQTILLSHPEHSASHYELANLMAQQGAKLEALFGFQMAIMINRSSTVLQKSYVGMEDVIQNNFEIKNEKAKNNKYFKSINNLIESGLAIKSGYKSALNLNYMVDKVCDLIFNQFNYEKGTGDFSMEYYGKFFGEIKKQELAIGYTLYVLSVINNAVVNNAIVKNRGVFDKFQTKLYAYWHAYLQEHKYTVNGKIYENDYVNDENGKLTAVGNKNDDGNREGLWTYFYASGKVAAEVVYNANGKLEGQNTWYAEEGYIKESGFYKDGKINGEGYFTRKNGCAQYGGNFVDNKLDGAINVYYENGLLKAVKNFKQNDLDGEFKEYYYNGKLASFVNIVDEENEGMFYKFYPNGDTLSKKEFTKGKAKGDFVEYHENGKVALKGKYKAGDRTGTWTRYYYDGTLEAQYSYKNGWYNGDYLNFSANGDTVLYCSYKEGKLHGDYKDYVNNKMLWKHIYKVGKLKKYFNYDLQGELLNSGKKEYVLNNRYGYKKYEATRTGKGYHGKHLVYFNNGKINVKKNYKKGVLDGDYTEYYKWGTVSVEKYYKEGKVHGAFKSYYDNGKIYAEGDYFEGDKVGAWKYHHPNGKLKKEVYFQHGNSVGYISEYAISGELTNKFYYKEEILYHTETYDINGALISRIKTPQGNGAYNYKSVVGHDYLKSTMHGGKHNGIKEFFYPNGQVSETSEIFNGDTHGKYQSFYPNGAKKEVGNYEYDLKEGEWIVYNHNGKISNRSTYKSGEIRDSSVSYYITGELESIYYYDVEGKLTLQKYYHTSGAVNCIIPYEAGVIHGEYTNNDGFEEPVISRVFKGGICVSYKYMKDGKFIDPIVIDGTGKLKTTYNNGKFGTEYAEENSLYEGAYKRMHSNGALWVTGTYIHNERDGLYTSYYTTGKKRYEANYEMGRLNGAYTKYNKNGKLISEVNYVQGTKEGIAKYYDLKGKLLYTLTYKNGVVVKVQ
ncbi:MAG: hypothetical protein P8Q42_08255 [Flavobacteriales bacterium]|nr:hypothetical protein [Flavobacteriales bacterium]